MPACRQAGRPRWGARGRPGAGKGDLARGPASPGVLSGERRPCQPGGRQGSLRSHTCAERAAAAQWPASSAAARYMPLVHTLSGVSLLGGRVEGRLSDRGLRGVGGAGVNSRDMGRWSRDVPAQQQQLQQFTAAVQQQQQAPLSSTHLSCASAATAASGGPSAMAATRPGGSSFPSSRLQRWVFWGRGAGGGSVCVWGGSGHGRRR